MDCSAESLQISLKRKVGILQPFVGDGDGDSDSDSGCQANMLHLAYKLYVTFIAMLSLRHVNDMFMIVYHCYRIELYCRTSPYKTTII